MAVLAFLVFPVSVTRAGKVNLEDCKGENTFLDSNELKNYQPLFVLLNLALYFILALLKDLLL